ncbi:F-box protein SKIP8 [Bienertia sinuspersici]
MSGESILLNEQTLERELEIAIEQENYAEAARIRDRIRVLHETVRPHGISSYDLVMRSWEYVWVDYEFPLEIELRDVQAHVKGDIGYVTCVEMLKTKGRSWGRQFATNVFERVDGQWLICVHHASPVDL